MTGAVDLDDLKARLAEQARALGFAAVGFAPAADDALRARRLHEWLAEGRHGEMEWMQARADVRQGPNAMWPEARSVIAPACYAPELDPLARSDPERAAFGLSHGRTITNRQEGAQGARAVAGRDAPWTESKCSQPRAVM